MLEVIIIRRDWDCKFPAQARRSNIVSDLQWVASVDVVPPPVMPLKYEEPKKLPYTDNCFDPVPAVFISEQELSSAVSQLNTCDELPGAEPTVRPI